jgi:hypothetical protein
MSDVDADEPGSGRFYPEGVSVDDGLGWAGVRSSVQLLGASFVCCVWSSDLQAAVGGGVTSREPKLPCEVQLPQATAGNCAKAADYARVV